MSPMIEDNIDVGTKAKTADEIKPNIPKKDHHVAKQADGKLSGWRGASQAVKGGPFANSERWISGDQDFSVTTE